ncbi:hypothetical protein ACHAPJ_012490 [Fusarium lateritium]
MNATTPQLNSNVHTQYDYVLEHLPVYLPTKFIKDDVDLESIATDALASLSRLSKDDFAPQPVWRDSMALTGTFRTFYSAARIIQAWNTLTLLRGTAAFKLDQVPAHITRLPGSSASWVTVNFTFVSTGAPQTENIGTLGLVESGEGRWVIWLITTVLGQLKGHADVDHFNPTFTNGSTDTTKDDTEVHLEFDAVVVGAGQAGLSVAGRLKALGVSYVVIDRMAKVGDNWKLRYDSTRLHTTREFAHLPFERTFTPNYQEYLTKNDVAKGFADWADKYDINFFPSTTLITGTWIAEQGLYELTLDRNGHEVTVTCRHVVMANGGYGTKMHYPQYKDRDVFKGLVLHSEEYKNPSSWKGKKAVVVGSANTAHDIAADMVRAGLKSIYLVQRERTYVIPATHFKKFADGLYNADIPTDVADRVSYGQPWAVSRLSTQAVLHPLAAQEPGGFKALEEAGFRVTQYGDLVYNLSVRRGGHYMDVGCSDLIRKGFIKVKSGALPVSYTPDGLICSDGTYIPADVVVFATSFSGSLTDVIANIFGTDVAANVGQFWGLDEEGEIRGAFKPTGQQGMWCAAGTIGHSRWHSRFIASQIKAQLDGHPFAVHTI